MDDKIKIRRPDNTLEEVLCIERNGALAVARVGTEDDHFVQTVTHEPTGTSLFAATNPDLARGILRALAAQAVDWALSDPAQLCHAIRSNGPCSALLARLRDEG